MHDSGSGGEGVERTDLAPVNRRRPNCPSAGKRMALAFVALLLVCCSSDEEPVEFTNRELGPFNGSIAALPLALWGDGPATLEVELEGPGSIKAIAIDESGDGQPLFEANLVQGSNFMEFELPGTGLRFLDIRIDADPAIRWIRARVREANASPETREHSETESLKGQDVIVLVADSLVASHLGCYGYDRNTSPVIDRLAAEGTRFSSASSQTSWTLPSVVTMFTSQEQERHGVLRMDQRLGNRLTTLAELFDASGYRTVGLTQSGVIQASTGVSRGFDEYRQYLWDESGSANLVAHAHRELAAPDRAPLFLYVHLLPPHGPYTPPEALVESFVDPAYDGPIDGEFRSLHALIKRKPGQGDPDVRHLAALYDGYVRYADGILGELIEPLSESSQVDSPLVVVSADHGEAFFEHGAQGHNRNIHQEMIHVPLVFWLPGGGWAAGRVVDSPASLLDILPTFQDLFELGETEQVPCGVSVAPLLTGEVREGSFPTRLLFLASRHYDDVEARQRGVRLGSHKFMRRTLLDGTVHETLYDLSADPLEQENLVGDHPIRAAALAGLLERWWHDVSLDRLEQEAFEIDPDRKKEIEALGYTGKDG